MILLVIEPVAYQPRPITRLLLCVALALVIAGPPASGQENPLPSVQSPLDQRKVPKWQTAAGGKMSFEVASIRQDPSGKFTTPPYSIDSDDDYTSTGGLFTADAPLTTYVSFAYKLDQMHSMLSHLPKWASTEHFEIRARAAGNPTKDQMRLMMQSLLADRFRLAIHFETRELPVLALTLLKPGKLGPKLRPHAEGPACNVVAPRTANSTVNLDMFPCNVYMAFNNPDHVILAGARNTTVELMAAFFSNMGQLGRPVVDRTGLSGKIDFAVEFTPEPSGSRATDAAPQSDLPAETFLEAVNDQLGLRLEPTKATLEIPVVDHVEMPSEN